MDSHKLKLLAWWVWCFRTSYLEMGFRSEDKIICSKKSISLDHFQVNMESVSIDHSVFSMLLSGSWVRTDQTSIHSASHGWESLENSRHWEFCLDFQCCIWSCHVPPRQVAQSSLSQNWWSLYICFWKPEASTWRTAWCWSTGNRPEGLERHHRWTRIKEWTALYFRETIKGQQAEVGITRTCLMPMTQNKHQLEQRSRPKGSCYSFWDPLYKIRLHTADVIEPQANLMIYIVEKGLVKLPISIVCS